MFTRAKRLLPLILVLVILLSLVGCSAEGEEIKITEEQLMGGITAVDEDIDTYQIDMEMLMSMSGESEGQTFEMSISYDTSGVVDNINKKIRMTMNMETVMLGLWQSGSTEMEIYLIGDTMYMKVSESGMPEQWTQQTATDLWEQQNMVEQQLELMEASEIDILNSEKVNGVDCYKVKLVPNLEKLFEIAMQNPASEDIFGEMPFDLGEMVENYSVTQWYAKDTYFPIKATIEITMVMSSEDMDLPGEGFEIEADIEMVINWSNYGEPVSIELPPEAEYAV